MTMTQQHYHVMTLDWRTGTTRLTGYGYAMTQRQACQEMARMNRLSRGGLQRDYVVSQACTCDAERAPVSA